MALPDPPRMCMCGHDEAAHEHWRADTECSLCGPERCPGFCLAPLSPELRRLLAVALGVPVSVVLLGALGAWLGSGAALIGAVVLVAGAAVWIAVRPTARDHHDGPED